MQSLAARPAWQIHAGGTVIFCLIGALAFVFFLNPLLNEDQQRMALQTELDNGVTRSRRLAEDLKKTLAQAKSAQAAVSAANLTLRSRTELNNRLEEINEAATVCGLQTDSIEPGTESATARLTTINIRLTARGNTSQTTQFLRRLHERMPDVPVVGIQITATPSSANTQPPGLCILELLWFTSGNATAAAN